MSVKSLGRIDSVRFGRCGYQDQEFGLLVGFSLNGGSESASAEICASAPDNDGQSARLHHFAERMLAVKAIMDEARVDDIAKLVGIPVEVEFESPAGIAAVRSWARVDGGIVMATHKATIPLSILDGSDGLFMVEFTYSPGKDACGPAYDHGGLPAEPAEIEIVNAWYLGVDHRQIGCLGLAEHEEERAIEWLFENWEPPEGPDADDVRDAKRDEALMERAEIDEPDWSDIGVEER